MIDNLKHQIENIQIEIKDFPDQLNLAKKSFTIEKKQLRLDEISKLEEDEKFWENQEAALKIQKEKSLLENDIQYILELENYYNDFYAYLELILEDNDCSDEQALEFIEIYNELKSKLEDAQKRVLLNGDVDFNNAIVCINAGAGGTESCDWAQMLHRMISRWSDSKKYKVKMLDYLYGDSAGIKSVTFMVEGPYAYGLLKSETGIHRLVRISPFDSNARRHTSFASIFISPEVDDNIEIEILDKDLKIDVYRSGGAGGQSVNTTDSAVRITHLPTNIIVTCQNERSQLQNKLFAMKILRSRLYDRAMEEKQAKQDQLEANKKEIGWGHQIRSYVLHPYKMVKDHRTQFEVGAAEKVLEGDLDGFIKAFLLWNALNNNKN